MPEVERLPDILSEIAGGPKALIHVGLHETGEDPTTERNAPMKGSNRVCLLSAHCPACRLMWRKGAGSSSVVREIRYWMARPTKGNQTPVLVNGKVPINRIGVNWR